MGICLLAIGLWAAFTSTGQEAGGGFVLAVLGLLTLVPGFFTIRRSRAAFIAATILSLNTVWWIANTIYLRNRWSEMSSPNVRGNGEQQASPEASLAESPREATSKEQAVLGRNALAPTTSLGAFE